MASPSTDCAPAPRELTGHCHSVLHPLMEMLVASSELGQGINPMAWAGETFCPGQSSELGASRPSVLRGGEPGAQLTP